jgi:FkbM family methyltransferase
MGAWEMTDALCAWSPARMGNLSWSMCVYHEWERRDKCVSRAVVRGGAWEPALTSTMLRRLAAFRAERPRLIDIGANIGFYTLAAGVAGFDVHAFEPVPRNVAMLQMSLGRNRLEQRVRLAAFAASDVPKVLLMGRNNRNQGGVSHLDALQAHPGNTALAAFPLADVLTEEPGRPTYVKMDVESSECAVVRGLRDWVARARIVGWHMEMKQSTRECCTRTNWTKAGGLFHTLHDAHGLRPRAHNSTLRFLCSNAPPDLVWG